MQAPLQYQAASQTVVRPLSRSLFSALLSCSLFSTPPSTPYTQYTTPYQPNLLQSRGFGSEFRFPDQAGGAAPAAAGAAAPAAAAGAFASAGAAADDDDDLYS